MKAEAYIDSDGSELLVRRHDDGEARYYNFKGLLHRLDGPAVQRRCGTKWWYQDGKYHRLDGPAVECMNGSKYWFVSGKEIEPLFLVAYWLERGRCCWYDESTQELRFGGEG